MVSTSGRQVGARFMLMTWSSPSATFRPLDLARSRQKWRAPDYSLPIPGRRGALVRVTSTKPVILVGSGLIAVDVLLSLAGRGHVGPVIAVSRRGLLPHQHVCGDRMNQSTSAPLVMPDGASARQLVQAVRAEIEAAGQRGEDWRAAVDRVRWSTPPLWQALAASERQRLLRHAMRHWEVHRHRMAPAVATKVTELQQRGTFAVLAGRILSCRRSQSSAASDVLAEVRLRRGGRLKLVAGAVVNCTGPTTDIRQEGQPLLNQLLGAGLVRSDPLGLGLDVTGDGAVLDGDGRPSNYLWAIGPLRKGQLWESTAVPELRDQAVALVEALAPRSSTSSHLVAS
jgi:uncharacterized NAD(P)/FAD-binding protein YdhS